MNNGDYVWLWFGAFEASYMNSQNANITKLLHGSAFVLPLEGYTWNAQDAFLGFWQKKTSAFADRVNGANPIEEGEPGYAFAGPKYFETSMPDYGSAYIYDAVMSIGFGACLAEREGDDSIVGAEHVQGIRQVDFTGATGPIRFASDGERVGPTITWGAFNLLTKSEGRDLPYELTHISESGAEIWTQIATFTFADNSNSPPAELRAPPDQNFINEGLRVFGLTLMSIAIAASVATAVWVYFHRKHRVLAAAQPYFLYLLAFGSAVEASTIFTISFDESYGWTTQQLSKACMATPWLLSMGHIIVYGALFSKLWRVNKVLQFTRRKIEIRHVAWPMSMLVLAAIALLSIWSGVDSLKWERVVTNDITGESFGQCKCDTIGAFLGPLVAIMLIPTILTAVMAWKTKDVDNVYSESIWIFVLIVVQLELVAVAAPVVVILRDVSTAGRYIGFTVMLWLFPMSTLSLIMMPKVMAHGKAVRGVDAPKSRRGASGGQVHVSGLESSSVLPISSQGGSTALYHRESPVPDPISEESEPKAEPAQTNTDSEGLVTESACELSPPSSNAKENESEQLSPESDVTTAEEPEQTHFKEIP